METLEIREKFERYFGVARIGLEISDRSNDDDWEDAEGALLITTVRSGCVGEDSSHHHMVLARIA